MQIGEDTEMYMVHDKVCEKTGPSGLWRIPMYRLP